MVATNQDRLAQLIARIGPLDEAAMAAARGREDRLTKPPGSLGRLEELAVQLAGIRGTIWGGLEHKAVLVMAGDHGVVAEGISAYPQAVTGQMVANFLNGGAAINVLARSVGARVVVVDMGVAGELPDHPQLVRRRIGPGTRNLAVEPAMSREQAVAALLAGAEVVDHELAQGLDLLATGDMGIGNTTPSAAIAAALIGCDPAQIAGPGTGLDRAGVAHKVHVIRRALALHAPDPTDGLDVLAKVGGFEIAGLAGAILAAAAYRRPVLVDGFISTAAAMIAVTMAPQVRSYLMAAHRSAEPGHDAMLAWLRLTSLLDLAMRLGEGTGAALAMTLVEAAQRILTEMASFDEAGVSDKLA